MALDRRPMSKSGTSKHLYEGRATEALESSSSTQGTRLESGSYIGMLGIMWAR